MGSWKTSLQYRLIAPIPILALVFFGAAWFLIPSTVNNRALTAAVASGEEEVRQIKSLRGYYAQNVIPDVLASGVLRPGTDHVDDLTVVPAPATFVHDINRVLSGEGTSIRMYSPFPFANRADRETTGFMQEA